MCSLTKEVQRFFKYIKHHSCRKRDNTIQPLWRAVSTKIINADRSLLHSSFVYSNYLTNILIFAKILLALFLTGKSWE